MTTATGGDAASPTGPAEDGGALTADPVQASHLDELLDAVLLGGRRPVFVTIVDYDPNWPGRYEIERHRLQGALGGLAQRVEHIGSTSVPGLAAKPVIDVLVEVEDPDDEGRYRPPLEEAGYLLRVREPRHRMFGTPARDANVHLWPAGSPEAAEYLVFQDWLRAQPADRRLYERTKRALAGRTWPDMNYYAEAKGPVVAEIRQRAAEAASR